MEGRRAWRWRVGAEGLEVEGRRALRWRVGGLGGGGCRRAWRSRVRGPGM